MQNWVLNYNKIVLLDLPITKAANLPRSSYYEFRVCSETVVFVVLLAAT